MTFSIANLIHRRTVSLLIPALLVAGLSACGATRRPDGGEGLLAVGAAAPALSAVDQHGKTHALADEKGHPVIVYFYPKDNTPGCTKEACAFRDAWDKFTAANVQVFGVSTDDEKSHEAFAKEQKLPFPILADPDKKWLQAFGVPERLGMASRVSFLIDASGKIAKVYPNVDPGIHADEVLKDATAAK
ncbi:MAG: peroxiredoxin [Polyangiaceae bacterium]|nr:peroxiredoxin [Polyangiaceae bacterium]